MPTPAGPGTNDYRCEACGRYFNNEAEFKEHQKHCVPTKQSGNVHADKHPEAGLDKEEDRKWVPVP